mmetsp:Transcript_20530/g.52062  ORF Transcript_20530/g.52062 Transcript_20530/m.52062 type:complete len:325 (-) Transcript_20530:62-1036(-)
MCHSASSPPSAGSQPVMVPLPTTIGAPFSSSKKRRARQPTYSLPSVRHGLRSCASAHRWSWRTALSSRCTCGARAAALSAAPTRRCHLSRSEPRNGLVAPVGAAPLPFLAAPFFEPATSLLVAPRAALTHEETPPSSAPSSCESAGSSDASSSSRSSRRASTVCEAAVQRRATFRSALFSYARCLSPLRAHRPRSTSASKAWYSSMAARASSSSRSSSSPSSCTQWKSAPSPASRSSRCQRVMRPSASASGPPRTLKRRMARSPSQGWPCRSQSAAASSREPSSMVCSSSGSTSSSRALSAASLFASRPPPRASSEPASRATCS